MAKSLGTKAAQRTSHHGGRVEVEGEAGTDLRSASAAARSPLGLPTAEDHDGHG